MFSRAVVLSHSEEIIQNLAKLISTVDKSLTVSVTKDTEETLAEIQGKNTTHVLLFLDASGFSTSELLRCVTLVKESGIPIKSVAIISGSITSGHIELVKSGVDDYLLYPLTDELQFSILYQSLLREPLYLATDAAEANGLQPAQFEALSEALTEGILQCDLDGKILYCNSRMSELSGFGKEELLGKTVFDTIVSETNRAELYTRYQNRRRGVAEEYEMELRKKDGTDFWAHISAGPFRNSRGEVIGVVGAFSDFSDVKSLAEDSNYRRLFLRQIIDTSPNIMYSVNADGRFSLVNQAFADWLGLPIKEIVGQEIASFAEDPNSTVNSAEILDIFTSRKPATSLVHAECQGDDFAIRMVRRELILPAGKERQVLSIGVFEGTGERKELHGLYNTLQKISAEAELSLANHSSSDMAKSLQKIIELTSQASSDRPASSRPSSAATTSIQKRKGVLIVDDEEQIVELLSNLLQVSGFVVYGFTSGTEAISWSKSHCSEVDAVVLDLKMQAMNGSDCLQVFKKICPNAPAIILSGFVEPHVEQKLLQSGAARFFHKPLRYAQLVSCLRELLGITSTEDAAQLSH